MSKSDQSNSAKKLIVVSAPSGAGKTTLCQKLLKDFDRLVLSISTTTRAPRGSEKDGIEYLFSTPAKFESEIKAGRFAEWANVHGNYYGTSKDTLEKAFAAGKSVLLDIDVQGTESLRKAYPGECFTAFISPPSLEVLESRLRGRGTDSEETIQKRIQNAKHEMAHKEKFDIEIVNHDLDEAYALLKKAVSQALKAAPQGSSEGSRGQ